MSALIALYLANVVLVILTLTWNGSFFYDTTGTNGNGGTGEPTVSPVPAAFMLLGVVGSEIIASRNGLGQEISYLTSTFNIDGVMGLVFLLAMAGYGVSHGMTRIERWLLRWQ